MRPGTRACGGTGRPRQAPVRKATDDQRATICARWAGVEGQAIVQFVVTSTAP